MIRSEREASYAHLTLCRSSFDIYSFSQGRVYKATQVATGQIVALKKSRAALALRNTLLNHERLLLQRLQGHPSIPRVFAYGRLKYFEYLAMEFLGIALNDVHERCPSLPAANVFVVADQMVRGMSNRRCTRQLFIVIPALDLSSRTRTQERTRTLRRETREHPPPPHRSKALVPGRLWAH